MRQPKNVVAGKNLPYGLLPVVLWGCSVVGHIPVEHFLGIHSLHHRPVHHLHQHLLEYIQDHVGLGVLQGAEVMIEPFHPVPRHLPALLGVIGWADVAISTLLKSPSEF